MSELDVIKKCKTPITKDRLIKDLKELGLSNGDMVLVHSSLSKIGWVVGKQLSVIEALLEVVGKEGTVVMPSFSGDATNPVNWQNPPVPKEWIPIIQNEMTVFDPRTMPTRDMGCIADSFWHYPEVKRSNHPHVSFSARGKYRDELLRSHPLTPGFGKESPLYRLYKNKAKVLLLGVGYSNCTCLHLAEMLQEHPKMEQNGATLYVDGKKKWVPFKEIAYDDSDFEKIGNDYEKEHKVRKGTVGLAPSILLDMQDITNYGVTWIQENRV